MNYVQHIKNKLEKESNCHGELLDLYTLLVLVKGENTTLEDVHDAWAVWKNNKMPEHRSLVPFNELSEEVQNLDISYRDAIVKSVNRFNHK